MAKKIHKTHFTVNKEVPWKRPVTISYVAGCGYACDVEGCETEASYMTGTTIKCTDHWVKVTE